MMEVYAQDRERFCPRSRITTAAALSKDLWSHFALGDQTARRLISNSAVSLAHELHASVIQLVAIYNFASATTLLRPLMEAAITAGWATYVCSEDRGRSITRFDEKLPPPKRMIAALQKTNLRSFGLYDALEGDARVLHDMTHGGIEQLRRRHAVEGGTYSLSENYLTVGIADLFLLLAFSIHSAWQNNGDLDRLLRLATNATIRDLADRYPSSAGEPTFEWERLPTPGGW